MADKIIYANLAKSTLASGISDADVSLAVQAGDGADFPSPSAGQYAKARIKDGSGNWEIVHITARSVDTLTIERGKEGTTARAFSAGNKIEVVVTKENLETFPQRGASEDIDGDWTHSGPHTRTGTNLDEGATNYFAASGTDTYAGTLGLTSLVVGAKYLGYFANANTVTAPTLNLDTLGAKTVKRFNGSALLAGDINGVHLLEWNGTDMLLLNPALLYKDAALGAPTVTTPARNDDSTLVPSTAWVRDHIGEPSSNLTIFKCGAANLNQNQTQYLKAVGNPSTTTESDTQVPIGLPTEFYGMKVYLSEAVPSGQTVTVTMRKDGADTSLTTTITGPTSAGAVVDVSGSVIFSGRTIAGAWEQLSVKVVCSATTGNTNDIVVALLAQVPGSNRKPVSPFSIGALAPSVGEFTAAGEFRSRFNSNINLALAVRYGSFPLADVVLEKFDQAANTAWPYTDNSTSNQVTGNYNNYFPAGTVMAFCEESAATQFKGYLVFSDRQCGGERGTWAPITFTSLDQPQNTTRYMGGYGGSGSATENDVKLPVPAGKARRLRAYSSFGAVPAGQSVVVTVRKNGVDTAITVTLDNSNRYAADVTNEVSFADNDLLSISCVSSATAGTGTYNVVLEFDKTD